MAEEKIKLPPDPTRMIEGLRDTGYQFNTSIADLVDNSIAANATKVEIHAAMDYRGTVSVTVADNGIGMDRDKLIKGMTYGSPRRPDPASLGKFGLGLKTASTAFCRRLSVITRSSGAAPVLKATWDLDHVAKVQEWELLFSDASPQEIEILEKTAGASSGTIVIWDKVDRLLKSYSDPGGVHARNALERLCSDLQDHLGLVYQRFLDASDKRSKRKIDISVQGKRTLPWDPFVTKYADLVAEEDLPVELDGEDGSKRKSNFKIRAYVLPRREEFPDLAAAERARVGNTLQGIYIYRENRLIHGPDWLGLFSKEPHGSLLRVEFSFDHTLDEAFHIDIKKSQILLNEDLFLWLDEFLKPARRAANDRYRQGQQRRAKAAASGAHTSSNVNIQSKEASLDTAKIDIVNEAKGEVLIHNKSGEVRLKINLAKAVKPGECFVQSVDQLDDGLMWQPALIEMHKAVQINTSHPYYRKVYVPNLKSGVTVQGMDSLLWALCAAEFGTVNELTKNYFLEMRFEVSKLLRRLVEDLPDPDEDLGE